MGMSNSSPRILMKPGMTSILVSNFIIQEVPTLLSHDKIAAIVIQERIPTAMMRVEFGETSLQIQTGQPLQFLLEELFRSLK